MDPETVITLGQLLNVPLMCPSGELTDGLEPHDHIYLGCRTRMLYVDASGGSCGVPGVVQPVGTREGYTGYYPAGPRLRLIYGYLRLIRFIRPFD